MNSTESPIQHLPPPPVIHAYMGRLYRELALLRRLLRLSQAARKEHGGRRPADREEVRHVG
jgi:hypothetical protein